jgi:methanogenic corrinoid protein MtbC1
MKTKEELIQTLQAEGKKVVDLGIGYDFEEHNKEIAEGKYADAVTISHFWSGIDSDQCYI